MQNDRAQKGVSNDAADAENDELPTVHDPAPFGLDRKQKKRLKRAIRMLGKKYPWPQFGPYTCPDDVRLGYNYALEDVIRLIDDGF